MSLSYVVVLLALLCPACVLILAVRSGRAGTRRAWIRGGRGSRRAGRAWSGGGSSSRQVPHVRRRGPAVGPPAEPVEGAARPWPRGGVADGRALSRDRVGRQVWRAWARRNRVDRPALQRLDRTINQPPYPDRLAAERRLPPVEQIAAELRRLDRQRRQGLSNESEKWSAAVTTAYDAWLLAACRRLDITEHLTSLAGMDLEIERVRVEGQLETAGLVLRSTPGGH